MTFSQARQNGIVDGFDGAGHKQTASIAQLAQMCGLPQQVLDLDRDVITELGEFSVHSFDDGKCVARPVEEIRVAEGKVFGTCIDLLADIFEDDFPLHDSEDSVVNEDNVSMAAKMFASTAGFGIAGDLEPPFWH